MRRYCGRWFSPEDLQHITHTIAAQPQLKRTPLSRLLCEQLDWRRPDGQLRDMSCRVALLRMQADGLISLPASQLRVVRRRACYAATVATDPQPALTLPVHALPRLQIQIVTGRGEASQRWNEFISRYHYLGYTPLVGNQMRYTVHVGEQLVALLGFGAGAWKLADRDRSIGWTADQRHRNLQQVVNNVRFLILPWIESKGLASKILARVARRLPTDWQQRYGYRPVLLETFVETPRHAGTCYKAANWRLVGRTTGRGKNSPGHQPHLPHKDIWLYPLRPDFARVLCQ